MESMTHYCMEVIATVGLKEEEDIAENQDIQVRKVETVVILVMVGMRSMDVGGSLRTEDILPESR